MPIHVSQISQDKMIVISYIQNSDQEQNSTLKLQLLTGDFLNEGSILSSNDFPMPNSISFEPHNLSVKTSFIKEK